MVTCYDALAPVYDECFRSTYADSVVHLLEHSASRSGDTWVLDLGCGTCDSARIMTRLGYKVVGLDLSLEMLRHASPAVNEALFLVCADMRALYFYKAFDIITCLNHGISYLTEDCEVQEVFSRIASHVRTAGVFCFDVLTKPLGNCHSGEIHMTKGEQYMLIWKEKVKGEQYVVEILCLRKALNGEWETVKEVHRQRCGSARHYAELAIKAGFQKVRRLRSATVQGHGTAYLAAFR